MAAVQITGAKIVAVNRSGRQITVTLEIQPTKDQRTIEIMDDITPADFVNLVRELLNQEQKAENFLELGKQYIGTVITKV